MARWIDADDIIAEQKRYCFSCCDGEETAQCSLCLAKDIVSAIIHHTQSIDIVQCGECRNYYNQYGVSACMLHIDWSVDADDYCSYGERRE